MALGPLGLSAPALAQPPGPESFAQEPQTPAELWSAINYLVTTGQSKQAVPYLQKFQQSQPDDATMVNIRERYGVGSILRLADDPATASFTKPLADRMADASRKFATDPKRLQTAVTALGGTRDEQNYGVARLKEAGSHAIPALIEALRDPRLTPEQRALVVWNMGRLEGSAVPALLAVLDSGEPRLQAEAATALGKIGDNRAIPFLTYPASAVEYAPEVREAAQGAIGRLTGRPFSMQRRAPAQVLADSAWSYLRRDVEFPGETVSEWVWDKDKNTVVPRTLSRKEAEARFARRLAKEAVSLQPNDLDARAAVQSIALKGAIDKVGADEVFNKDRAALDAAIKAGPEVLSDVLRRAIADSDDDLAAVAANVLGRLTDASGLAANGRPHPLVEALWAPGPRAPLAAARALVDLAPTQPFRGSSRLVPVLARYLMTQQPPRAVIIDDNPSRGSQLAGAVHSLGYMTTTETRGDQGFLAAAETADVEAVFVSHAFGPSSWTLTDILANLKSDSRTSHLPVYVYGPLDLEITRPNLPKNFPGIKYVVQPLDGATLEKLIGGRPSRLSDADRGALAGEASTLLARIASRPGSPFAEDLSQAEPALAIALNQSGTSQGASTTLGDVPDPDAQRSLASVVLDTSRPDGLRKNSADQLVRSIQKFGPLVSADQELQLVAAARLEADPQLRSALAKSVLALRAGVESNRSDTLTPASPPSLIPAPSAEPPQPSNNQP